MTNRSQPTKAQVSGTAAYKPLLVGTCPAGFDSQRRLKDTPQVPTKLTTDVGGWRHARRRRL